MGIVETNLKFNALKKRSSTKRAIIHHSASSDVSAATIHGWHKNQGWAGIGYHFVIRANGTIERGRPEHTIGAHAGPKGNGDSIGICLAGNFETGKPAEAQVTALVWLLKDYLFPKYGELKVIGHKDVMATACPGRNFPWDRIFKKGDGSMFQDITYHWAKADIEYLATLGIVKGDDKGNFRPDDPLTRAQACALVSRAIEHINRKIREAK